MLQDVTLGGTGKESGDRHPKIRQGVLIGAGAKILGNIEVGTVRPRRRRLGGAEAGAAQHHGRGRARAGRRQGRLRRAARTMDQLLARQADADGRGGRTRADCVMPPSACGGRAGMASAGSRNGAPLAAVMRPSPESPRHGQD